MNSLSVCIQLLLFIELLINVYTNEIQVDLLSQNLCVRKDVAYIGEKERINVNITTMNQGICKCALFNGNVTFFMLMK